MKQRAVGTPDEQNYAKQAQPRITNRNETDLNSGVK